MAKTQNLFVNQKADSDTNYALFDNKSFVRAENLRISGDGDDGSFKSLKGSKMVSGKYAGQNSFIIRKYEGRNNKLYYCVANKNKLSTIVEYDTETEESRLIIQDSTVLRFDMLRWDEDGNIKDSPFEYLLSFNQIGDFLIFSSQYWEYPRMVNLTRVADYAAGFSEEDIVIAKKPPKNSPIFVGQGILNYDNDDNDKFVSFAYRYKYLDGEFSALSFYSGTAFEPQDFALNEQRENKGMLNKFDTIKISVDSGGENVTDVEVYAREHKSNTAYLIYAVNKDKSGIDDESLILNIIYKFSKNYTVLDDSNTKMLYSNIPKFPETQDVVGNRIFYANYDEGYDLKDIDGNDIVVDYQVSKIQSTPSEGNRKTAISLFRYKPGIVFLNDYNESTTVLLPTNQDSAEVEILFEDRFLKNDLQVELKSAIPQGFTKMKFVVKTDILNYENIFTTIIRKVGNKLYIKLDGNNINKIKTGDKLIPTTAGYDFKEFVVDEIKTLRVADGYVSVDGIYAIIIVDESFLVIKNEGQDTSKKYNTRGIIDYEEDLRNNPQRWSSESGEGAEHRITIPYSDFGEIKAGDTISLTIAFNYGQQDSSILTSNGYVDFDFVGPISFKFSLFAENDSPNIGKLIFNQLTDYRFTVKMFADNVTIDTNIGYANFIEDAYNGLYNWQGYKKSGNNWNLAVIKTSNVILNKGYQPIFFRTKNADDISELYFETEKTYPIINGIVQSDSMNGANPVFNIGFYNGYSWGNGIESYKIKDAFNAKELQYHFRGNLYDKNGYKRIHRKNDITYSGLYNHELKINELSTFNPALLNWKNLSAKYGPIKRILSSDNNITVYCVNKVMLVMYEKSVLMDLTGNESLAKSNEVLGADIVIDYECGVGNNPESVVSVGNAHIFADPIRKRLYSKQGRDIQELNFKGSGCFNEFVKLLSEHKTFLGSFDDARAEYVLGIDQNFSVAYSIANKGISAYFKNKFDYIHSMDGKSFTAYRGKLYQNEVTDNQNEFAGQGVFAAKIIGVVNPQMESDKVFKAWYLQSNTGWDTEIRTNLTSTVIPESAYVQKESFFHTEIFRDNNSPLGIKGVGNIQSKVGNQLIFKNPIENTIAIGDTLNDKEGINSSKIIGIDNITLTVQDATEFSIGEFVFVSKLEENGYRPDGIPMRGQWMEFTLTKVPEREIFLTSVYTEVIESKL